MLQLNSRKTWAGMGLSVLGLALALQAPASAQNDAPASAAFDIAARSDRTDRGFRNSRVEVMMILRNATGQETERRLELTTLELPSEDIGDRTLVKFTAPADIAGTALLSHAQILKADDQWLFLPSLQRIKRISSANKSGPFVGSEFAFEDMTGQELNKYDYTLVGTQACGRFTCDLVERKPRYEGSAYSRQIAWIDQSDYQLRKVEYFDRKGDRLKTLDYGEYRRYGAGIWRPHVMVMDNHQTRKSTQLRFGDYQFGLGLTESDFVKGSLSRLR